MIELKKKKLSVVVSVYNEELSLKKFYETIFGILERCTWEYELIFVNDGSVDSSIDILQDLARENQNIKVVDFSRNFGHEAAMIAGIDHAQGDGVVCMTTARATGSSVWTRICSTRRKVFQIL